jgi:hypothetical protein
MKSRPWGQSRVRIATTMVEQTRRVHGSGIRGATVASEATMNTPPGVRAPAVTVLADGDAGIVRRPAGDRPQPLPRLDPENRSRRLQWSF